MGVVLCARVLPGSSQSVLRSVIDQVEWRAWADKFKVRNRRLAVVMDKLSFEERHGRTVIEHELHGVLTAFWAGMDRLDLYTVLGRFEEEESGARAAVVAEGDLFWDGLAALRRAAEVGFFEEQEAVARQQLEYQLLQQGQVLCSCPSPSLLSNEAAWLSRVARDKGPVGG